MIAVGVATEEIIRAARDLLPDPGRSTTSIGKFLGLSLGTFADPDRVEARVRHERRDPLFG
ncbi:hypothetical protein ACIG3E_24125 [Streptomyces sp. NPDC053474]|uniref:hypothetical protein n=1 Tax=Streptomyces sp. NPDC053474 TaxID=3365704 RepID=UPI0037CDFC95